ncbi:MAG TPA: hypothetical protein VFA19_10290 [Gaiellaceae bacterium]|nr:hypothetical protein [Gaiellaceae bacterium]
MSRDGGVRADDRLVTLLSQWLVGTLGNDELRREVEAADGDELAPGQRRAVEELLAELRAALPGERAGLQVAVREALEALAYGE